MAPRHESVPAAVLALACFLIAGWQGLVVGFFWSTVAVYHGTFSINSLAHVWGRQRYVTGDYSRNNWVLAVVTMGEGWHNNHHAYQSSARQGFRWWEFDATYGLLSLLRRMGVIWKLKFPPVEVLENRRPLGSRVISRAAEQVAERFNAERIAGAAAAVLGASRLAHLHETFVQARQGAADVIRDLNLPEIPGEADIRGMRPVDPGALALARGYRRPGRTTSSSRRSARDWRSWLRKQPPDAAASRRGLLEFLPLPLKLYAHLGDVAGARADDDRLRPAVRGQRKPGSEGPAVDLRLDAAAVDATLELTRHAARGLAPGALKRSVGSLDVARNVELEALAGAYDALLQRIARRRIVRAASDRFLVAVRPDNVTAPGPLADEALERIARRGLGDRRGERAEGGKHLVDL